MMTVEQRLERLERRNAALAAQNLGMKRAGLAGGVLAGAALLMGQAGAGNQDPAGGKARDLKATSITLVDAAGQTRIELGVDKDGAGLDIRDARGKTRVAIGEGTVEGLGEGSGVWVFDEKERPRVGLGIGKNGSGLIVLDENGKPVAGEGKGGK